MTIHFIIHRGNKYTIDIDGNQVTRHYPKKYIAKLITEYCISCDNYIEKANGDIERVPIFVHNNNNSTTTTFNVNNVTASKKDKFKVPNSVRYVPNKLVTFQEENWKMSKIKHLFNQYETGKIDEQTYRSEMRKIL